MYKHFRPNRTLEQTPNRTLGQPNKINVLVVPDEGTVGSKALVHAHQLNFRTNWFLMFAFRKLYFNTFKSLPIGKI